MPIRRYSLVAALTICVAAGGVLVYRYLSLQKPALTQDLEAEHGQTAGKAAKALFYLYFSDPEESHLTAENQTFALPNNVVERAKAIVQCLIDGPTEPLTRTVPKATKLLALYVTQQGVAYVDFNRAIAEKHPGGSLTELLSIYSIVNTLCLNIPEIKAVKILIEGREAKTLAGHIDIRYPLRPDLLMIK